MLRFTLLLLAISAFTLSSCSSTKSISENPRASNCQQNFKNDFERIAFDETFLTINSQSKKVTEAKFICLHSFLQTKKLMYDNFGDWNVEVLANNDPHPLLIWNSVPILENSSEKFTVITTGEEKYNKETYASISILDENGRDALAADSKYKTLLIDFFSDLIRQTNHEDEEFYKIYLKKVSPKKWEKLYGKHS